MFKWLRSDLKGGLLMMATLCGASAAAEIPSAAPTPPMGWNSWDCFGATVTEAEVKANAASMAERLARHGWQYIVVDIQWYEPQSTGYDYHPDPQIRMDEWSRALPVVSKFPSAEGNRGFKPLADYVHGLGLKFGLHFMRGIPRSAVRENRPILGTTATAAGIADTSSTCPWNPDMYGVDLSKPGAQAYYDSLFQLWAEWGVDYVKIDDLSRPYHQVEIEAIRSALDRCGRPMVFSTSPGETPLWAGAHVSRHAEMWRISDDFWDEWPQLVAQFERLHNWTAARGLGHWPDADMIPFGHLVRQNRTTHFTPEEQKTLMSLWCIARSPLIYGGHLPDNDAATEALLTNDAVLAVNQRSEHNRQLFRRNDAIAWVADIPGSRDRYLALFNLRDPSDEGGGQTIGVELKGIGLEAGCTARDLWAGRDLGRFNGRFSAALPPHGSGLFRLTP